ncbi:hypothetical protein [Ureibacillus chungkukjangi]|uniref:Lipoprotein n=1 Tax=Ureibacillus chungkukjangi TaxID=1202712 RepID=A0A318TDI2_9BACL|nr:hypothetical protein [Ureibacillus chungkukjangi]MCM3389076.1 hypothetical protein [Ureibacillus chungkukjangi]PYF02814.1 hypothetical protein BJ095_1375 [Ureibacillus chungkukjangi]
MKRKWSLFFVLALTTVLLSGCLFPEEQKAENQIPDDLQLASVQKAVEEFQADTGVLPIKTRDMDTDQFIKYPIDFEKLIPKYLTNAPANSFEKGGLFQYIIWDPEENPTVKLVDLRSAERIRELNIRFMSTYYPTFKDKIADYVYSIDFEKIGYKEPLTVQSPYSNNLLPIIVTTQGEIYIDYSVDLNIFIKENNLTPEAGEDIRMLLVDAYPVVPAYSLPYTVDENNEPIFMYDPTETQAEEQASTSNN